MNSLILSLVAAFLLWGMYSTVKRKPELFSSDNLNKSFFTIGILAVILIVVIGLSVILLAK